MRFYADGPTTTVRYYFTDKPPLPIVHRFGSRNWLTEGESNGVLGEVEGATRKWVNGSKVGSAPGDHFCGTPEQWLHGQSLPPSPPVPVTEDGTPVCCFGQHVHADHLAAWNLEGAFVPGIAPELSYEADIDHSRSQPSVESYETYYGGNWDSESEWTDQESREGDYEDHWFNERQGTADYSSEGSYSESISQERSSTAGVSEEVFSSAAWNRQGSWGAVQEDEAGYPASWSQEGLWTADTLQEPAYGPEWDHERDLSSTFSWSAVVTTFDCGSVVAAGSTQGTATAIANDSVSATSTGANQGVILPAGCFRIIVKNNNAGGGNAIKIYPPVGASISGLATNAAISLNAGAVSMFAEISATEWRTITIQ